MSTPMSKLKNEIMDYGPDSGGRIKGLTVVKPVVYGSISQAFLIKRENKHTHQWKVYLKPYLNEDMSTFIKKVQFKLHNSYPDSLRTVNGPPYEIIETGWGEFEVTIKIFFRDPAERPLTLHHQLKLFNAPIVEDESALLQAGYNTLEGLVSESYDEMVFKEPTRLMERLLADIRPITSGPFKHYTDFEAKKKESLEQIIAAKPKVRDEIVAKREALKLVQEAIAKYKAELAKMKN